MFVVLTNENFRMEVLEHGRPVLVEICAEWCGNCHIAAPILEKLAHDYAGQMKFGRLDADANAHLANEYGARELPMLLLFKSGKLVDCVTGAVARNVLEARLQTLLQTEE